MYASPVSRRSLTSRGEKEKREREMETEKKRKMETETAKKKGEKEKNRAKNCERSMRRQRAAIYKHENSSKNRKIEPRSKPQRC